MLLLNTKAIALPTPAVGCPNASASPVLRRAVGRSLSGGRLSCHRALFEICLFTGCLRLVSTSTNDD
ncbi:MAG: hypothetical protein V7L20_30080 [Nostoc sp.]|uniref:hypothetical protein n=1 Tax=Nostoc sp. TaxID=1180 RepID=UPI002FFC5147